MKLVLAEKPSVALYVIIIKETPRDRTVSGRFVRGQTNEMNARIL